MTKAYSNKALPSGTILREWRLEEVLGVGGFGIVYKGRGIYFDELVAIKEYFPSAISERDAESTVVPIDSDAEEVHALGLKKFVEEAKLLWNLSTPSRHPNIVSVRSLFEIHGTAYMVMDFEDGVSLTGVLKRGEKFDEAKLREMVLPVASGLERAHRVGVLHRDIKPSNILITDSGQPVLIDFGSARFETEGVTSTTVTFHTPPYAAIEQYVKAYEQGPWTDIYALGVVLYRCITGEKPAEVLERLHGEKEPLLVDGNWRGYSKEFLAAVDAAMIIKPSERPRSLPEWIAMFDGKEVVSQVEVPDDDEDATRIVPIAASVEDLTPAEAKASDEPKVQEEQPYASSEVSTMLDDIGDAGIERSGDATTSSDDLATSREGGKADAGNEANSTSKVETAKLDTKDTPTEKKTGQKAAITDRAAPGREASRSEAGSPKKTKLGERKKLSKPLLLAGGLGLLALGGLGWSLSSSGDDKAASSEVAVAMEPVSHDDGFGLALKTLVDLAREKNINSSVVSALERAGEEIAGLEAENSALSDDETRKEDVSSNRLKIADSTRSSLTGLATGLDREVTGETRRLAATAPWADPRRSNPAANESDALKGSAAAVKSSLGKAKQAIESLSQAETAEDAFPLAQEGILAVAEYKAAVAQALSEQPRTTVAEEMVPSVTAEEPSSPVAKASTPAPSGKTIEQISAQLNQVASATDSRANEVIGMARIREPRRDASEEEKQAYRTLESNAGAARDYKNYLDTLKGSMRGAKSTDEAERLLLQGLQTQQYVNNMIQSSRSSRAILER